MSKGTLEENDCHLQDRRGNPLDLGHLLDQSLPVRNKNDYQDFRLFPGDSDATVHGITHLYGGCFTLSPGGPAGPGGPMGPTLP